MKGAFASSVIGGAAGVRCAIGHDEDSASWLHIEPGSREDLERLSHLHYRSGPPATLARGRCGRPAVLRALDEEGRLAGVLAVSMPTLNGAWRRMAWPGRFASGDKRRDAARLNSELRCISRVIVEPRFRGQGVARRLVERYLRRPLTPCTEAVAAMGGLCPFFERAGMTAYPLPPSRRDARLLDAIGSVGLEAWELLDAGRNAGALAAHPWLAREARLWADSAGATRAHKDDPAAELLMRAACAASTRPIAYAHGGSR